VGAAVENEPAASAGLALVVAPVAEGPPDEPPQPVASKAASPAVRRDVRRPIRP
jgi:hypothetical protein